MDVRPASKFPTRRVNADWFTGTVWQDPVAEPPAPTRAKSALVSFEPGARTNWHHHPLGQSLYVVSGTGRAQVWGQPVIQLNPGDRVWIPPGEKHWHGASPEHGMVHLAIHESDASGAHVTWLERVTDEQYAQKPGA